MCKEQYFSSFSIKASWVLARSNSAFSGMQGTTERSGGRETAPEELLSLLPLQTRHVELSEQENTEGITTPRDAGRSLPI